MSAIDRVSVGEPMPNIESVSARAPCSLEVFWRSGRRQGTSSLVDLAPLLFSKKIFAPLRDDESLFRTVHVVEAGAAIAWGDGSAIDVAATTIESLADETMTPADFAEFLRRNGLSFDSAAAQLGISRRLVAYYAKEREIPRYIALACAYLDFSLAQRMTTQTTTAYTLTNFTTGDLQYYSYNASGLTTTSQAYGHIGMPGATGT